MSAHYQDERITVHKVTSGPLYNNAYVLICPETNESIVIDAPAEPANMIAVAGATTVRSILITHSHWDHIDGLGEVVSALGAPVGIGEGDAPDLPTPPDFILRHGETVEAGSLTLKLISTPGHTPGSTCISFGDLLFTGDTLFPGGPGRTRTPSDLAQLLDSISGELLTLDDGITFYPGHGDDGALKTAKEEYAVFASRPHPADLCGDVAWLES